MASSLDLVLAVQQGPHRKGGRGHTLLPKQPHDPPISLAFLYRDGGFIAGAGGGCCPKMRADPATGFMNIVLFTRTDLPPAAGLKHLGRPIGISPWRARAN